MAAVANTSGQEPRLVPAHGPTVLPFDELAASIACMAVDSFELNGFREAEEILVGNRFTGLACIDYADGSMLTLILGDGVVLGAHYLDASGAEAQGLEALDIAEGKNEMAVLHLAGLRMSWISGMAGVGEAVATVA